MKNKYLLIFSSICTYLCFLGLILLSRKPLCVDSSIVHKIDRVSSGGHFETAYACTLNRLVEYSTEMDATITKAMPQLERTVLLLESIKPFQNKIQIAVHEDRPLMFQVDKNKISIGSQFLNLDHYLSRALIKTWLNEQKSTLKLDTTLLEESLTDFVLYVLTGKVELEDPIDRTRTKLGSVKWPQVIKTAKGYCLSAWKLAEHVEGCKNNDALEDHQAIIHSLRPLLTSSLIASYNDMKLNQKNRVLQNIPSLISKASLSSEKIIEALMIESNPLRNGLVNINKFTDLILAATSQDQEIHQLYTGLMHHLQLYGVSDSFAEAYFDYMIEVDGAVDAGSNFYKNLQLAAVKNTEVQVALKDANGIRILPSRTTLPLSTFNQIQSQQTILMSCQHHKNTRLENFFKKTEKLMLINGCDAEAAYDFDSLLREGIKSFISSNRKLSFVQFHMASLEMIQNKLMPSLDFFELLKGHDISRKEFKTLGWSELQWKKDLQAYRPQAVIEAIEYFRN